MMFIGKVRQCCGRSPGLDRTPGLVDTSVVTQVLLDVCPEVAGIRRSNRLYLCPGAGVAPQGISCWLVSGVLGAQAAMGIG